jgi:hypothetical protein
MKWNKIRVFSFALITTAACALSQAAVLDTSNLPGGSNWYVHVNLDLIQNTEAGREIMLGTVNEALEDIEDELGIDLGAFVNGITLFGGSIPQKDGPLEDGAVVLHGSINQAEQQTILDRIEKEGVELTTTYKGSLAYYTVANEQTITSTDGDGNVEIDHFGDSGDLYFSFGDSQILVTHDLALMQTFVDSSGYLGGFESNDPGALVVLHADRALVQGGANTVIDIDGDWDSSILKNMESIALVIEEVSGGLHISAELTANSADAAMSVRNIAEGLVALKALEGGDDVMGDLLRSVKFENEGSTLSVNLSVAPDQISELKDL